MANACYRPLLPVGREIEILTLAVSFQFLACALFTPMRTVEIVQKTRIYLREPGRDLSVESFIQEDLQSLLIAHV